MVNWLKSSPFGNFKQSTADQSLFSYRDDNGKWLLFTFYVDDGLYFGDSDETEMQFLTYLKSHFNVEDKGNAHWFLGMRIHQFEDGSHTMDQNRFLNTIINKFCPTNAPWGVPKHRHTPAPLDYAASKNNRPKTEEQRNLIKEKYKTLHFASEV